ncbi:MAG TPA: BamA/TamA family outer membrane protein [Chitinophagaceae bacterium]|nr:BamA/TamA family outer membrane protein [Chitinophagaceae bacterium]
MVVPATKLLRTLKIVSLLTVTVILFYSCSTINYYQPDKPFVYETNINVEGNLTIDERKELEVRLQDQVHDSIRVRRVQRLVGWQKGPRFFYSVLTNPAVFDSLNAGKSIGFMHALLNSMGYERDSIHYDTTVKVVPAAEGTQLRTTVNFTVYPGKLFKIDSVNYILPDSLQLLTKKTNNESFLKKGEPFSRTVITSEFNRLTELYRNNGYLRFSFEELLAVWDTVGIGLLRPTLDPIEQAQLLEALRNRRENPTADIEVRLRANQDSSHLIRYFNGDITIYPDITADTALLIPDTTYIRGYKVISYRNIFKPKTLAQSIYLRKGELYSQRNYYKTLNRINSIGAWRLVTIDQLPRSGTDTVDYVVRLSPAKKYSFTTNTEVSQNFGNNVLSNGNLVGFNLNLQNRNFARAANLANTNFRFATEINNGTFVQTKQISFSHSIYFPRVIPNFKFLSPTFKENIKTVFGFNTSYTSRKDFFDLSSVNGSWGYETNWKNKFLTIRLPNVEYTYLRKGSGLQTLIAQNRSYEYIFNSGLVVSGIGNLRIAGGRKDITNLTTLNLESSGLISGLFKSKFLEDNLHRFIKTDAEFRQTRTIRRSAFAWRTFLGIGYQLPSSRFKNNRSLPFFKSYIAGGANSMRAWRLRELGPGSTIKSFADTIAPERFGDMQIEANAEYRFYLTDLAGFKINSVLFTDIGNIWNLRKNTDFPGGQFIYNEAGKFQFNKLWTDLAIAVGTGLRVDLGFFLIRVDYAFKAKDPSPALPKNQNGWFSELREAKGALKKLGTGQIQLGVTYPF